MTTLGNPSSFIYLLDHEQFRTYHISVARRLGSVNAAIFLSEMVNRHIFHEKNKELTKCPEGTEGWFYYTTEKGIERLCLSEKEQRNATKLLEAYDLIEKKSFGLPNKKHFRLKLSELSNFLDLNSAKPVPPKGQTGSEERPNCTYIEDNHVREQATEACLPASNCKSWEYNVDSKLGLTQAFVSKQVSTHGEAVVLRSMGLLSLRIASANKRDKPIKLLEPFFLKLVCDSRAVFGVSIEKNKETAMKFKKLNPWLKIRICEQHCIFLETNSNLSFQVDPKEFHHLFEKEMKINSDKT